MLETIIVGGIVAIVAVMAVRSFYRTMTDKNDGCNCVGKCPICAYNDFEVTGRGQDTDK